MATEDTTQDTSETKTQTTVEATETMQTKPQKHSIELTVDHIIAIGLVSMGHIAIVGWIAYSIISGNSNGTEIPMALVSGLTGALTGKSLASAQYEKKLRESQMATPPPMAGGCPMQGGK